MEVLAHLHDHFRVAAKSVLQAYAGHMAREKEEAANASKRAARRLRRSSERAAGGGDAVGVAESDDDNEAESDDERERLENLEAMEHGELDWDDDDVYGLGCLLYFLLSGRHLFADKKGAVALQAQLEQTPPRMTELVPGLPIPPDVEAVVFRALAKSIKDDALAAATAAWDKPTTVVFGCPMNWPSPWM